MADPKNFEKGEDNLSDPSSFIANAHNELYIRLYAFYTGKKRLTEKKF